MEDEPEEQDDLNRPNQWIRCHELRVRIECPPAVLLEQEEINIEMDDEKAAEKEPCQGHKQLAADGGIVPGEELIHRNVLS
jgi:hypothetical protein